MNVTDEDIRKLRDDASEVRNYLLASYCRRALAGDDQARVVVVSVLDGTYRRESDDG